VADRPRCLLPGLAVVTSEINKCPGPEASFEAAGGSGMHWTHAAGGSKLSRASFAFPRLQVLFGAAFLVKGPRL
jgi:hypothetical protein